MKKALTVALTLIGISLLACTTGSDGNSSSSESEESNSPPTVELIDSGMRVQECDFGHCDVAWKVTIKNRSSDKAFPLYVECEFLDEDGFRLDYSNANIRLKWNTEKTITETAMIAEEKVPRIESYRCAIK